MTRSFSLGEGRGNSLCAQWPHSCPFLCTVVVALTSVEALQTPHVDFRLLEHIEAALSQKALVQCPMVQFPKGTTFQ